MDTSTRHTVSYVSHMAKISELSRLTTSPHLSMQQVRLTWDKHVVVVSLQIKLYGKGILCALCCSLVSRWSLSSRDLPNFRLITSFSRSYIDIYNIYILYIYIYIARIIAYEMTVLKCWCEIVALLHNIRNSAYRAPRVPFIMSNVTRHVQSHTTAANQ